MVEIPAYMEQLIHTADGLLKSKELPEDIKEYLIDMTGWREEVNSSDLGHECGDMVRDDADHAAKLCDKYGLVYHSNDEYDDNLGYRQVFSDGTHGEWCT